MSIDLELIKARLAYMSNDGPTKDQFVTANLKWFRSHENDRYTWMLAGERYYNNENDILVGTANTQTSRARKKRMIINEEGQLEEDTRLTNTILPHPFMRKFTRQIVSYKFSKPFSIKTPDESFSKALDDYMDKDFNRRIQDYAVNAVKFGVAFTQVYYDVEGKLKQRLWPSTEVCPIWADMECKELAAVILIYKIEHYKGASKEDVELAEFWHYDEEGNVTVDNYIMDGDNAIPDKDNKYNRPPYYFYVADAKGNKQAFTFDKLPFIVWKSSPEMYSLLKYFKNMNDEYDWISSMTADWVADSPFSIKVFQGFGGQDATTSLRNMKELRAVYVDGPQEAGAGSGDKVYTIQDYFDLKTVDATLTRLRRDAHEHAPAFDTQETALRDASGTAIRIRYNEIDNSCEILGNEFASSIDHLMKFIRKDILLKTGKNYDDVFYEIIWNVKRISDTTEDVTNALTSKALTSLRTALSMHPAVTDVNNELKMIQEEEQWELDKLKSLDYHNPEAKVAENSEEIDNE